jgi:GT2 family glycosyltransferase
MSRSPVDAHNSAEFLVDRCINNETDKVIALGDSEVVASVVITTLDRLEDTLRAVASCYAQDYGAIEVLVFDDASDVAIGKAVQSKFPQARCFINTERLGYIVNRNRGFHEARGRYVFSLDDDAYFSEREIVRKTVSMFEADPKLGAVAIPYIEPLDRRSLSSLNAPCLCLPGQEVRSFIGCAHALRRDAVLALGGYREYFYYLREEQDLSLRLQRAGWKIEYGIASYVVHMRSPQRDNNLSFFYGIRNQMLYTFLNLPLAVMIPRLLWEPVQMLRYRFSFSSLPVRLRGIMAGFIEMLWHLRERSPITLAAYRRIRSLPTHGAEAWDSSPPPPCGRAALQ